MNKGHAGKALQVLFYDFPRYIIALPSAATDRSGQRQRPWGFVYQAK